MDSNKEGRRCFFPNGLAPPAPNQAHQRARPTLNKQPRSPTAAAHLHDLELAARRGELAVLRALHHRSVARDLELGQAARLHLHMILPVALVGGWVVALQHNGHVDAAVPVVAVAAARAVTVQVQEVQVPFHFGRCRYGALRQQGLQ